VSIFCTIDDKYVPIYRILWIGALPHFCGGEDCQREGEYEVRLEHGESVWATRQERDEAMAALETWHGGEDEPDEADAEDGA
jgi:hypothetical protein